MRRPLGNGMPLLVKDNGVDNEITVFDAATLDPSQVWQVTAFVWPAMNGNTFVPGVSKIRVKLITEDVSSVIVVQPKGNQLEELENAFDLGNPPKLIDRLVLRGQQKIVLSYTEGFLPGRALAVWGYFEANGSEELPSTFRPLEPAPLAPPFNALPTVVDVAPFTAGETLASAHLLNHIYPDLLTLNVDIEIGSGGTNDSLPVVRMPNGVQLRGTRPLSSDDSFTTTKLFDGVPFLAPSPTNNAIQIGFVKGDTTTRCRAVSYGFFTRVS